MKKFKVGDVVLYTNSFGESITAVVIDRVIIYRHGYRYFLDKYGYTMDFSAGELELVK